MIKLYTFTKTSSKASVHENYKYFQGETHKRLVKTIIFMKIQRTHNLKDEKTHKLFTTPHMYVFLTFDISRMSTRRFSKLNFTGLIFIYRREKGDRKSSLSDLINASFYISEDVSTELKSYRFH